MTDEIEGAIMLPPAAVLRAYLEAAGWTEEGSGSAGSMWSRRGARFGVPHDDDPDLIRGALDRLAAAEGRTADETAAAVLTFAAVADAAGSAPAATARALPAACAQAQERAGASSPDPREPLGQIVHGIRLACEAERAAAEGRQRFNLQSWEDRDDWRRGLDMRIGKAVADYALAENAATYGIECASCAAYLDRASTERERAERAEAQLCAFSVQMPAIRRALAVAINGSEYEAEAGPYRDALAVLGGEDTQERSDEEGQGNG